jgi:hypothetical protein
VLIDEMMKSWDQTWTRTVLKIDLNQHQYIAVKSCYRVHNIAHVVLLGDLIGDIKWYKRGNVEEDNRAHLVGFSMVRGKKLYPD